MYNCLGWRWFCSFIYELAGSCTKKIVGRCPENSLNSLLWGRNLGGKRMGGKRQIFTRYMMDGEIQALDGEVLALDGE